MREFEIMNASANIDTLEVGYDVPAVPGMDEADIQTPCLVLDLDALERNIKKMGGAVGVCCQKVSEAEVFARGGIKDVLVSNQVRDPAKINRLATLPKLGARIIVCVDDIDNVSELSAAAVKHGTELEVFIEIDCGAGRCGVTTTEDVVAIAKAVDASDGLKFSGIQAYQGAMQHLDSYEDRKAKLDIAIAMVEDAVAGLKAEGLEAELVSGGGTGSYYFESNSGVFNELQCGSYAFMDADYGRILDQDGNRIDRGEWENAFFILTQVMSHAKADKAICDAGLKAQSVDSGLPVIFGRDDVEYIKCSDEHGVIADPSGVLAVGDKLRLIPGHCDPTANVHDWYVGVRNGKVETLWPVSARGKAY